MQTLLDRLVEKAGKYGPQLGTELKIEFETLRAQFESARSGQLGGTGDLSTARTAPTAVAATRATLEKQMMTNVLTLALKHLGDPERAKDYFSQWLLEDPIRQNEDSPAAPSIAGTGGIAAS